MADNIWEALEGLERAVKGEIMPLDEIKAYFQAVKQWVETVAKGQTQMGEKYNWAIGENVRLHTKIAQWAEHASQSDALVLRYQEVLGEAESELKKLHGLIAVAGLNSYSEAQREGCDPKGAWDCFVEETFTIDTSPIRRKIENALTPHPPGEVCAHEWSTDSDNTHHCTRCGETAEDTTEEPKVCFACDRPGDTRPICGECWDGAHDAQPAPDCTEKPVCSTCGGATVLPHDPDIACSDCPPQGTPTGTEGGEW